MLSKFALLVHIWSKQHLGMFLFLVGWVFNKRRLWSDACSRKWLTTASRHCNNHPGEPKNLSNLSSTKPSPSLMFPQVYCLPLNPKSFITIASAKDLQLLKEYSGLFSSPTFSVPSNIWLKSPLRNHLAPHFWLLLCIQSIVPSESFHLHWYTQKLPTIFL